MIITIDGPVATGKSVVARKLAESIGFIFFDTGAMYRIVTLGIHKHNVDIHNAEQLEQFLKTFQFDIKVIRHERHYFFEGEDVTPKLRLHEVTSKVSEVSAIKAIRDKLIVIQRELSEGVNAIFDGRDMGTVVFPDAALKIFLTGDDQIRAQRRYEELKAKHPEEYKDLTLEECLKAINRRDHLDSTREHSPLCKAKDAYVIDTTKLSIEDVVIKILECMDSIKTKQNITT